MATNIDSIMNIKKKIKDTLRNIIPYTSGFNQTNIDKYLLSLPTL
ncbi:protein of unknown function [Candidatus Nitrosocosmicus franklandus]|uniref:Uncharacterized protein n=1 Tax=Candidatus Nitrosocosmicus franklandianus TaxID=1798806 RepID=A0A484IAG7_9ARCH|nr:protein of unknown function [Candidatus Nitrosocosmicus franklandus]